MPAEAQIVGGHKANLHNPNTSTEAKEHSKEVLREDFNGELPLMQACIFFSPYPDEC